MGIFGARINCMDHYEDVLELGSYTSRCER